MSLRNITDTIPIQREKLTGKGGNLAIIPRIAIFLPTFFHSYHFEMGKRPYETLPIVGIRAILAAVTVNIGHIVFIGH